MSLFLSRRVFDFLAGTGLEEHLDEVFDQLEATLRRKDIADLCNPDRKLFDVNEAPRIYGDRAEHVNDIVTALLREERLYVIHDNVWKARRTFLLEPYTLLVYKKGLYVAGFSHHFAPYVERRMWHPSQKIERVDNGIELSEGAATAVRGGARCGRTPVPVENGLAQGSGVPVIVIPRPSARTRQRCRRRPKLTED